MRSGIEPDLHPLAPEELGDGDEPAHVLVGERPWSGMTDLMEVTDDGRTRQTPSRRRPHDLGEPIGVDDVGLPPGGRHHGRRHAHQVARERWSAAKSKTGRRVTLRQKVRYSPSSAPSRAATRSMAWPRCASPRATWNTFSSVPPAGAMEWTPIVMSIAHPPSAMAGRAGFGTPGGQPGHRAQGRDRGAQHAEADAEQRGKPVLVEEGLEERRGQQPRQHRHQRQCQGGRHRLGMSPPHPEPVDERLRHGARGRA